MAGVTFKYGESVTILTAGTVYDPYSTDAASSWTLPDGQSWTTPPSQVDVAGVAVEPRPSSEQLEAGRNAVVNGYTLYFPSDTVIGAHNRVIVRGGTYDVLGGAAEWRNPFTGWAPGIVVQVTRTAG